MSVRTAKATWQGNLKDGKGRIKLAGGAFDGSYSFASRFAEGKGTNPEELIAAAHAGCYSMALSHMLAEAGFTPREVTSKAAVHLEKVGDGFAITIIQLTVEAQVPGIDVATFLKHAEDAKTNCPVSKALAGAEIRLDAKLVQS
jgi:osmotically inducible protein OsmC